MVEMSKKPPSPSQEGTAAAAREAARMAKPMAAVSPGLPKRRKYAPEYKQRILLEADAALASGVEGAVGNLLRREGLYSSHLAEWRKLRDSGVLAEMASQQRSRKPARNAQADEVARLERRVAHLEIELKKAETIIDVQKKLSLLLGLPLKEPTEEDFSVADTKRRR